jgi:IclR family acetate operon transcriptional repressor
MSNPRPVAQSASLRPGRRIQPTGAPPPTGGLTSVDNALWLLQLIAERQALRVAEAADLLGVARSTAHRLLSALRQRGFVAQDRPNGAYRPGPALTEIGLAAIARIDIRRLARPALERLRDQALETASLAVLEGSTARFIDCLESTRSVRVGNRTGIARPAHASAVGKALLAELSPAELARRYPDVQLAPGTPAAITDRAVLLAELEEVRTQGYALNWSESAEGVSAVAVVVHDSLGLPVAAVGIAAPSSRTGSLEGIRAHAPAVIDAARTIEGRLAETG